MIITIRTTMMTTTMNSNTNTYTNAGDHEWQTAGLKIHHVLSPWHNCHNTMSLLKSISSTSQQTTLTMTVYSLSSLASSHCLSIAPTTTPTSYVKGTSVNCGESYQAI